MLLCIQRNTFHEGEIVRTLSTKDFAVYIIIIICFITICFIIFYLSENNDIKIEF